MASPQSKSRYIAALRDQPSPTERGRSKVLGKATLVTSDEAIDLPSLTIDQNTNKGRIASRWQAAAQSKVRNAESDVILKEQDKKPIVAKFFAQTSPPPPPPPPSADSTRRPLSARRSRLVSKAANDLDHSVVEPPSIMRTKKNWDAENEIPPGTVRQSPFQPNKGNNVAVTTDQSVHPPPIERLKKQWDAKRDIPKGTVQARQLKVTTEASEREGNDSIEALKKLQWDAQRDIPKGAVTEKNRDEVWSPRSADMDIKNPILPKVSRINTNSKTHNDNKIPISSEPDVKAVDSPKRQWNAAEEIPKGAVVEKISSGRMFFPDVPNKEEVIPPQLYQQKKQWDVSKDIPAGKVKGISTRFVGTKGAGDTQEERIIEALNPPASPSAVNRPSELSAPPPPPPPPRPPQSPPPSVSNFQSLPDGEDISSTTSKPIPVTAQKLDVVQKYADEEKPNDPFFSSFDVAGKDEWTLPMSPSGPLFTPGTWGEEAMASHSLDDSEGKDWFQSNSFIEADKNDMLGFGDFDLDAFEEGTDFVNNFDGNVLEKTTSDDLDDSEPEDENKSEEDTIGSFAAAIQPVWRHTAEKPETVTEEPEEEEFSSDVDPMFNKVVEFGLKQNVVNKKVKEMPLDSTSNSKNLKSILENSQNKPNTSDESSKTSKVSKSSKGSILGFRKKADKPEQEKKQKGGLFRIFARKDNSKNEEASKTNSRDRPSLPPIKKADVEGKKSSATEIVSVKKHDLGIPKAETTGSLGGLTEELKHVKSKGVISTRDDMTAVSEITNPDIFPKLSSLDSNEEKAVSVNMPKSSNEGVHTDDIIKDSKKIEAENKPSSFANNSEEDPFNVGIIETLANVWPSPGIVASSSSQPLDIPSSSLLSAESDPFDLNSSVFSSGDPFEAASKTTSKGEKSTDIFVESILGTDRKDDDEEWNQTGFTKHDETEFFSFESEAIVRKPFVAITTDMDVPDPDILLLSSDDEAENDDPTENIDPVKIEEKRFSLASFAKVKQDLPQMAEQEEAPLDEALADRNENSSNDQPFNNANNANRLERRDGTVVKPRNEETPSQITELAGSIVTKSEMMTPPRSNTKRNFVPKRTFGARSVSNNQYFKSSPVRGSHSPGVDKNLSVEKDSVLKGKTSNLDNETNFPGSKGRIIEAKTVAKSSREKRFVARHKSYLEVEKSEPSPNREKPLRNSEVAADSSYLSRFKSKSRMNQSSTVAPAIDRGGYSPAIPLETSNHSLRPKVLVTRHSMSISQSNSSDVDTDFPASLINQKETNYPSRLAARASRLKDRRQAQLSQSFSSEAGTQDAIAPKVDHNSDSSTTSRSSVRKSRIRRKGFDTKSYQSKNVASTKKNGAGDGDMHSIQKSSERPNAPISILKKPKIGIQSQVKMPEPLSPYNDKKVTDPMHRAGLRLLAAAVIPIQALMRGYLARCLAQQRLTALIVIQAYSRRWLVMERIDREDEAALIIQAAFADYLTREYARVLIQSHVRRWLVQRRLKVKKAATKIQSHVRRWFVQRDYHEYRAAVVIQKYSRGLMVSKKFKKMVSALRIQKCVRGWIAYKRFWLQVLAAIEIQTIFRGWYTRDCIADQHYCATQVQRIYRGYKATMAVYEDIYRVTLVQSYVRMKIAMEKATDMLALILQLQSMVRGYFTRKKIHYLHTNAVTIQRYWRGCYMRLNYQLDLFDIILIQNLYRQRLARKMLLRLMHERQVASAILIQTQWRCYDCCMSFRQYCSDILIIQTIVRRWIATRKASQHRAIKHDESAICIQTCWRGYFAKLIYHLDLSDITIIQNLYRGRIAKKVTTLLRYERDFKASRSIQTVWRGYFAKMIYQLDVADIVFIQSLCRRRIAMKRFKLIKNERDFKAACSIQAIWRGYHSKLIYELDLLDIIIAQNQYRKRIAMERFKRLKSERDFKAACLIQAIWRGHYTKMVYQFNLGGIIYIQNFQRKKKAMKVLEELKHERDSKAARLIQSIWRGYYYQMMFRLDLADIVCVQNVYRKRIAREKLKKLQFIHRERSATLIQSLWRCHDCTMNYLHYLADVLICQSVARRWSASRFVQACRDERKLNAARLIQSRIRGYLLRNANRRLAAAILIQKMWRGFGSYAEYMFTVADIVLVQTQVRSWMATRTYKSMLEVRNNASATSIQTCWRGFQARKILKLKTSLAILCQCVARCYFARKLLRTLKIEKVSAQVIHRSWTLFMTRRNERVAATLLQSVFRGVLERIKYKDALVKHYASILIQTAWRRFWCFSNFIITLDNIIVAQSVVRCFLTRADLRKKTEMATKIQSRQRCVIARRLASSRSMVKALLSVSNAIEGNEMKSILILQTNLRGYASRSLYFLHRNARTLQCFWRCAIPRRKLKEFKAARCIQTWWRRLVLFISYKQYKAATKIQTCWRVILAHQCFKRHKGAKRLQALWRMYAIRKRYVQFKSATKIQATWRCYCVRENYLQWLVTVEAAIMIQSAWRSFICYTDYMFTLADIVTVQRHARGFIDRMKFSKIKEEHLQKLATKRMRERLLQTSATRIQSLLRGYVQRINYVHFMSARDVQRVYRGYLGRSVSSRVKQEMEEIKARHVSAVTIQSIWRGYDQKMKYWYLLGCIIQIQCVMRGITARLNFVDTLGSIIVVQSISRRWFAIRNYKQMRLIMYLLRIAQYEEEEKHNAANTIQSWYRSVIYPRRRAVAAIKIQSFFRMIRAMVDREIKAEKKRRKLRKKEKMRQATIIDDLLLEDAWECVSPTNDLRKGRKQSDILQKGKARKEFGELDFSVGTTITTRGQDVSNFRKNLDPPSYYIGDTDILDEGIPARTVRLRRIPIDDSDAMSEMSGLTAPTVFRGPPSRMEQMNEKDLTADLSLEEAWVDLEIENVKRKKRTMAKGRQHKTRGSKVGEK